MVEPEVLARLSLFKSLPAATLATLARGASDRWYAPGEVIFLAGTAPAGLHLVLAGQVRVVQGRGNRQHVVHWEGPGGTLGDVPLFAGGSYPATAIAAERARCAVVSRAAIHAAIATDPEVAFLLLERLSLRVRGLVSRLDRIALQGTTARLANHLSERVVAGSSIIRMSGTQADLAEELGTVREIVVRGLQALCRRGAIRSLGRGRYEVVSAAELRRAAEE